MAENIFSKIAAGRPVAISAADITASRNWFREAAQKVGKVGIQRLFTEGRKDMVSSINITSIGSLYTFIYDAKTKEKLPYWDAHPLSFIVDICPGGFHGINTHYLPPNARAKLMDALYGISLKEKDLTKLQLSYKLLKGAGGTRLFKPCFKRYLMSHVRSEFLFIEPSKWDVALMLPTAKWMKQGEDVVYRDSMGMI